MERKYSISEIDQMRRALEALASYRHQVFHPAERAAAVEDRLRTHMLNGTDPEELEEEAQRWMIQCARDSGERWR